MIDGITSRPFSAVTIAPSPSAQENERKEEIIRISRLKYAHPVKVVEDEINNWASNMDVPNTNNPSDLSNPQNPSKPLYQPSNNRSSDSTKLYDVKCSSCGKDTKVIFEPVAGRPVYCKNCLKKMKAGVTAHSSTDVQSTITVSETPAQTKRNDNKRDNDETLANLGIEFGPALPSKNKSSSLRKDNSRSEKPVVTFSNKPNNYPKKEEQRKPSTGSGQATSESFNPVQDKYEEPEKIEAISFHSSNRRQNENSFKGIPSEKSFNATQEKPKRKEINLVELRKALEESLLNRDEPEKIEIKPKKDSIKESPLEELKKRVEEEKLEDKALEEDLINIKKSDVIKTKLLAKPHGKTDSIKTSAEAKKEIMKPGETIKF